jgi:ribosomal protein S18 acetylase RimI-like enzyme
MLHDEYRVEHTTIADLEIIYWLFDEALIYQQKRGFPVWNGYDKEVIKTDIEQRLQFKVLISMDILCVFSICLNDPVIWREKNQGDAVYLHRIVVNPNFKGQKQFEKVLTWAKKYARDKNLKYIRMDTWAENDNIIQYYKSFGFQFIEDFTNPDTLELPVQNRNLKIALLEMDLDKV